ncbi:energy transducer TonB [Thermovibrio sp.]
MRKAVSLTLSVVLNLLLVIGISKLISLKEKKEATEKEISVSLLSEPGKPIRKAKKIPVKEKKEKIYRKKTAKKKRIKREAKFKNKIKEKNISSKLGKKKPSASDKEEKREGTKRKSQRTKEKVSGKGVNKTEGSQVKRETLKGRGNLAGKAKPQKEKREEKPFDLNAYKRKVIKIIEKEKFYPPLARRLGIEGKVKVVLVIGRKGELLKAEALSGNRILKKAAVKLLKRCRFPPLPENFKGREVKLELSISYKLYQAP